MDNNTSNKLEKYKEWMARELDKNSHKGSILEFTDINEIITQLEYHKAKLLIAMRCKNPQAIKEYIADTSNFLFCLGNVYGLYNEDFIDILDKESVEIRKDKNVFSIVTQPQINQSLI